MRLKKDRQVTVRLTRDMAVALMARAARDGADRSEVVRQALAHELGMDATISSDHACNSWAAEGLWRVSRSDGRAM